MRAVLLMIEHGDEGALGVTLNRPIGLDVVDHLPAWTAHLSPPAAVFAGGPVHREMAVGLAYRPSVAADEGWAPLLGGVGLIDLTLQPEAVVAVERLRVFAGYAGWGPGQLELELAVGSWFVLDATPSDPFDGYPEDLWRRVLRRQRGATAFYAVYPEDRSAN
jgi:putative transcriptional regulator